MLVTNSEYKFHGDVSKKRKSFLTGVAVVFANGLRKMAKAGERHANEPMLSIELAMCVAQCMGKRYLMAVKTAGLG